MESRKTTSIFHFNQLLINKMSLLKMKKGVLTKILICRLTKKKIKTSQTNQLKQVVHPNQFLRLNQYTD